VRELNPICHYIVCREDLPRGIQAAMLVHAAGESSPGNLAEGTYAVVLAVRDAKALAQIADRLRVAGVDFVAVFEPDPPYDGELMALGLRPARKEHVRRHLSALPLLR
jgi:hypothetical protein